MHRFYCQHADFTQKEISITDRDEIHHIRDVLRLKSGDELYIFNGQNQQAKAVIRQVKEMEIQAGIDSVQQAEVPPGVRIILACAVPKKAKFEFIIEKCTELGVDEIIPLRTKRTEVVFAEDKIPAKQERFQKVALNAAKQCGRVRIPKIHGMISFADALKLVQNDSLGLIPSLNGRSRHIREVLNGKEGPREIVIFIGPEGDFTPEEVRLAEDKGCLPVSLGTTVLKVDTAAIAAVALARFLYLP